MKAILKKYCSLYKTWTKEEKEQWREVQVKGIVSFILVEGILKWGLIASLGFMLAYNSASRVKLDILFTAGMWFLGSILYGYCYWVGTKESYYDNE